MDEKMYTVKSAAQELHYSERQIRQMCIDGKLPGAYKIPEGRKWIIPESAINSLKVGDRKQQWVVVRETIEQKGYEETPHKEKMRTLARKLADSICLPSLLNAHLWRDLPADFQPGKYRLPVGVVEIGEHK